MPNATGPTRLIACASIKDTHLAVHAACQAFSVWSHRAPWSRGQSLYRIAELLEGRTVELANEIHHTLALSEEQAHAEVIASIDRIVSIAGWADKISILLSRANPATETYFNCSNPHPMGPIAVLAPKHPSLLGLITAILPILVSGNTCVAIVSEIDPCTPNRFAECFAASELPAGAINLLMGNSRELIVALAKHGEIAGVDLWTTDDSLIKEIEELPAIENKRICRHLYDAPEHFFDNEALQGLQAVARFVTQKTIWHPRGI